MFESLTGKFTQAFSSLRSRGKITSADIDQVADQIYQALLEADVFVDVDPATGSPRLKVLSKKFL